MKTYAIGDIHGGYKALLQCLERSGFDKDIDTLISLGDIADGWSQVPQCVDELLSVKNLISIKGNHDEWCGRWFENGWREDIWVQQGGQSTIDAYVSSGKVSDKAHVEFWKSQINYHIDSKNRLYVHGGYSWKHPIDKQPSWARLTLPVDAIYYWDRNLWETASMPLSYRLAEADNEFESQYKEIFIGHTSTENTHRDLKPVNRANVWNLDQGGGWSGRLTIMNVDTHEYWQSDLVKELYPNELGRG